MRTLPGLLSFLLVIPYLFVSASDSRFAFNDGAILSMSEESDTEMGEVVVSPFSPLDQLSQANPNSDGALQSPNRPIDSFDLSALFAGLPNVLMHEPDQRMLDGRVRPDSRVRRKLTFDGVQDAMEAFALPNLWLEGRGRNPNDESDDEDMPRV